ncbi:MAG: sigma-70 family RNA polymerase sigma factor [Pirellulales bacterium]
MERTDAELVEGACNGDIVSFRELYERHYAMAVAIAKSRLSDPHLAEDAAQEAFATACRRLASLKNPQRFGHWLGTICRRAASRMARSRTNHAPIDDVPIEAAQGNGDGQAAMRVRRAVARLPAAGRDVIWLHYFSGLSYQQISQTLGITPQSVHGRLQRARRALAEALAELEE